MGGSVAGRVRESREAFGPACGRHGLKTTPEAGLSASFGRHGLKTTGRTPPRPSFRHHGLKTTPRTGPQRIVRRPRSEDDAQEPAQTIVWPPRSEDDAQTGPQRIVRPPRSEDDARNPPQTIVWPPRSEDDARAHPERNVTRHLQLQTVAASRCAAAIPRGQTLGVAPAPPESRKIRPVRTSTAQTASWGPIFRPLRTFPRRNPVSLGPGPPGSGNPTSADFYGPNGVLGPDFRPLRTLPRRNPVSLGPGTRWVRKIRPVRTSIAQMASWGLIFRPLRTFPRRNPGLARLRGTPWVRKIRPVRTSIAQMASWGPISDHCGLLRAATRSRSAPAPAGSGKSDQCGLLRPKRRLGARISDHCGLFRAATRGCVGSAGCQVEQGSARPTRMVSQTGAGSSSARSSRGTFECAPQQWSSSPPRRPRSSTPCADRFRASEKLRRQHRWPAMV